MQKPAREITYQGERRTVKASDEQVKLIGEIWTNRERLGLDVDQEVIKRLTTDEHGNYLPEAELRRINLRYKNEHRGKETVAVAEAKGGGEGTGPSCVL